MTKTNDERIDFDANSGNHFEQEWYTFTPDGKQINSGSDPGDEQGNRTFLSRIIDLFKTKKQ